MVPPSGQTLERGPHSLILTPKTPSSLPSLLRQQVLRSLFYDTAAGQTTFIVQLLRAYANINLWYTLLFLINCNSDFVDLPFLIK